MACGGQHAVAPGPFCGLAGLFRLFCGSFGQTGLFLGLAAFLFRRLQHVFQVLHHFGQGLTQGGQFAVKARAVQLYAQIAAGHLVGHAYQPVQRPVDGADDQQGEPQGQDGDGRADQPHIADIPVGGGENFVLGLQRRDFPAVFRGAQRGQHGDAPHAHGHHAVLGLLQGLQAGVFDVLTNDVACGVGVLGVRKDAPRMFNKHEVAGLAEVQLFEAGGKPGQGHVHAEYAGKVAVRVNHLVGDG